MSKYAVLVETNGKEMEQWYYFIRYDGNEEALAHLQKQLEEVDFYIIGHLSTFDLDLEHLVSETTAKEMTKVEVNSYMFHRKFDGKLQKIDLGFKAKKEKTKERIVKCFEMLGIGQVDEYISDEDIDEEDLTDNPDSDSETEFEYNDGSSDDDLDSDELESSDSDSDSD